MGDEVDEASAALIARLMEEDAREGEESQLCSDSNGKSSAAEGVEEEVVVGDASVRGRRSKRRRRPPQRFEQDCRGEWSTGRVGEGDRLDMLRQMECEEQDPSEAPFKVLLHPCARALMELHSHLAETEVIGYLGGSIVRGGNGDTDVLHIAEAFPTKCVDVEELGRQGRDAYVEVEMDPESDVEVRTRVALKGLEVVGWYHSHPYFSCQPSLIDVENQLNYQNYIYKNEPYIAAIVGPYCEDHCDFRSDVMLFYVRDADGVPVRLHNVVTSSRPHKAQGPYYCTDGPARCPIASFENEGMALISQYAEYCRRAELLAEWRDGVSALDKLRMSLGAFARTEGQTSSVVDSHCPARGSERLPSIGDSSYKSGDKEVAVASEVLQGECIFVSETREAVSQEGGHTLSTCSKVNLDGLSSIHRGDRTDQRKSLDTVITNLLNTAEDAWRRFKRPSPPGGKKKRKKVL